MLGTVDSGYDSSNDADWDKWISADVTLELEPADWYVVAGSSYLSTGLAALTTALLAVAF